MPLVFNLSKMEQHRVFEISPRSYVEFKRNSFYFYSHIELVKPIILNKTGVKNLLLAFKELQPIYLHEHRLIENELTANAELVQAGKEPLPSEEKLVYSQTLAKFKCWEIRQLVSKYQENLYIWTKLFVQDSEDPNAYYPCKGGILWEDNNYEPFENFVNNCIFHKFGLQQGSVLEPQEFNKGGLRPEYYTPKENLPTSKKEEERQYAPRGNFSKHELPAANKQEERQYAPRGNFSKHELPAANKQEERQFVQASPKRYELRQSAQANEPRSQGYAQRETYKRHRQF
jgi:hypothetical protein